uniref:Transducin/WD40 repeat-like superfamily protein n=1 Tax=Panagrellus redivivus TaxID=6233 RepID=A0A7E4UY73_PANRE
MYNIDVIYHFELSMPSTLQPRVWMSSTHCAIIMRYIETVSTNFKIMVLTSSDGFLDIFSRPGERGTLQCLHKFEKQSMKYSHDNSRASRPLSVTKRHNDVVIKLEKA